MEPAPSNGFVILVEQTMRRLREEGTTILLVYVMEKGDVPHEIVRRRVVDANGFGLIRLQSRSSVRAEFLPTGVLFALRHRSTLINQLLPGPAENGLFRLVARWSTHGEAGVARDRGWASLVGPGLAFARAGRHAVRWATARPGRLAATTTFALHPQLAGWTWRVHLRNVSRSALGVDVFHAQDLGLADEAAVRNNEAYVSQYLDLLPVADPTLGWMILARQNEATAGGRHPWLVVGVYPANPSHCGHRRCRPGGCNTSVPSPDCRAAAWSWRRMP
ncbi:MAG TPA: hypothetical protein VGL14_02085 [Methylomirabilota bacterium]